MQGEESGAVVTDTAMTDTAVASGPGIPAPAAPASTPGAAIVGGILGLGLLTLAGVAIRDICVQLEWISGDLWSQTAGQWLVDLQWNAWTMPAAIGAVVVGLYLLWIAVKPRQSTHIRVADHDGAWTRRVDVARRCSAEVSALPGVHDATTTVTRRWAKCTVTLSDSTVDRDQIEAVLTGVVAVLESPPRVKIRIAKGEGKPS